jgi:hypothetical protein
MLNLRRVGLFSMPLRAAFAFVFLIFALAQPALSAASGVQGVVHGGATHQTMTASASDVGGHQHAGRHVHSHQDAASTAPGHDGSAGKSCEVHCAPAHAMPVACPEIAAAVSRCFVAPTAEALPRGEYAVHIRPPRHLI